MDGNQKPVYPKRGLGKVSAAAKENIIAVFVRLGGTAEMARWAKENQTEFYRLYGRLLPVQVDADITHNFVMAIPAVVEAAEEWTEQSAPRQLQS